MYIFICIFAVNRILYLQVFLCTHAICCCPWPYLFASLYLPVKSVEVLCTSFRRCGFCLFVCLFWSLIFTYFFHISFQDQPCTFCDKYNQTLVKLLQMIWGYATSFLLGHFLCLSVYISNVWKIHFTSFYWDLEFWW